jgi:uncharacterized protein
MDLLTDKYGMKGNPELKPIYEMVSSLPVFSDHDHHLPDSHFAADVSLDFLLANSYVAWTGFIPDGTVESRRRLLENVRFNSYFTWFQKGLQQVHRSDESITLDTWDSVSGRVRQAYAADRNFHWRALSDNGFEKLVLDTYWDPGQDNGHSEVFIPTFRIDKFMYGHHADAIAPDDIIPWARYGFPGGSLDDYVDHMRATIQAQYGKGLVVAFKCAEAYNRPVDYLPDDREAALRVFGRSPGDVSPAGLILFGNYVFNRCCELAAELDVPFQIHTGLAMISGSQPMNFEPIIARYPQTRFVLFHSGFPWTHQISGLVHNYRNAYPSLTWTATVCTSAAIRALDDYIDVTPSINTITWGSDCWVAEESVGAMLAWRFVVAKVLAQRLRDGRHTAADAEILARRLMYENGRSVYRKK